MSEDGRALRYATEALKGDREVVMKAVSTYGRALQYVTKDRVAPVRYGYPLTQNYYLRKIIVK